MVAIYEGAELQIENAQTGRQGILQRMASFGANALAIRRDNRLVPGKEPRAGTVDYAVLAERPFFQLVWEAIRDGVLDLVLAIGLIPAGPP